MNTRKLLLLSLALVAGTSLTSCDKDDDNTQEFSTLTVEENKKNIEDEGIKLLGVVKEVENLQVIDYANNLLSYVLISNPITSNPNFNNEGEIIKSFNTLLKPVVLTSELKNFNASRIAKEVTPTEEELTLLGIWNNVKGTYTWNNNTESWDFATGNEIALLFSATETSTSNNAKIRVYDFQYENGPFSWLEEYTGELPKQIKYELTVDNKVVMSYSVNIEYNNTDKKPNSIKTVFGVAPFVFTGEVSNTNNQSAAASFSWKKDKTTLILVSMDTKGNWSETNLANDNNEPGDVFTSGNVLFQVMNVKVAGNANIKTINAKANELENEENDKIYAEKMCEAMNTNASLNLCYVNNNQIIAKIIAAPIQETESYWDWDLNQEVEETYWSVGMKFKFKDDSTIDMGTYFGAGFDKLISEVQLYIDHLKMNNTK